MSRVQASLKRFAVCATILFVAPQAFAAVLILEGSQPPSATPTVTPPPPVTPPQSEPPKAGQPALAPQPSLGSPGILEPPRPPAATALLPPNATVPEAAAPPPSAEITPEPPMVASDLGATKVANPAELAVELLPGQSLSVGSRVSFRVTSKKAGYLVLIDVDATGHLTQIYPNTASLVRTNKPNGNYIKPGGMLTIPLATDPYGGGIEYVVSPPNGQAMIVAILSAQPVQILDLPDVPPESRTQSDALAFLAKWTSELRIPDEATSQLREARWSFNAKPYVIR